MGITKFSKDVFLVGSDFKDFNSLDTLTKNNGLKIINKVINRLTKLGFTKYKLLADDSLSIEIEDILKHKGLNIDLYDVLPDTSRETIINNIIPKGRRRLVVKDNLKTANLQEESKKIMQLELEINKLLLGNLDIKKDVMIDDKVDLILKVLARKYFGLSMNEEEVKQTSSEVLAFLASIDKTEEELVELIKQDIDYRWEWAKEQIYNESQGGTQLTNKNQESLEEFTENDEAFMEILDLLNQGQSEESKLIINIDEEVMEQERQKIKENLKSEKEESEQSNTLSLTEALQNLSREEFIKSDKLIEDLDELLRVVNEYSGVVYSRIIKESNLIFDFYVSRKSIRSRKLPYDNPDTNTILVSVDLKSGDLEAVFKGRQFKINPFFQKGEEVKTNALEW